MNIAIILAGGTGSRFTSPIPKQYIEVNGVPLIVHTIGKFQECQKIDSILVVASKTYIKLVKSFATDYNLTKVKWVLPSGDTRQESSYNAVMFLKDKIDLNDIVVFHDAVRPLVSIDIIENTILNSTLYGATMASLKARDAIIKYDNGKIIDYFESEHTIICQTPQTFIYRIILKAHEHAKEKGIINSKDDCYLISELGYQVSLTDGNASNIKVTYYDDIILVEKLLKERHPEEK